MTNPCPMTDAAAQAGTLRVDACPECGSLEKEWHKSNMRTNTICRHKWHDGPAPQQTQSEAVKSSGQSPQTTPPREYAAASGPTPRPLKVVELLKVLCNTNTNHYLYDDGFCKSQKLADAAKLALEDVERLERELAETKDQTLRTLRGNFGQICSCCGWESKREGGSWDDLQEHIKTCKSHPLCQALERAESAERKVAELLQVLKDRDDADDTRRLNRMVNDDTPAESDAERHRRAREIAERIRDSFYALNEDDLKDIAQMILEVMK